MDRAEAESTKSQASKTTGVRSCGGDRQAAGRTGTSLPPERPQSIPTCPPMERFAFPSGLDWLKRANAFIGVRFLQDVKPLVAHCEHIRKSARSNAIRKATDATIAAHMAAMRTMKPGITEREISALLQYEWGKRGCERPAYAPIVGSGFNSTVLHYSEDSGTIQAGDVVVIDAAGEYSMYASDITRTSPAMESSPPASARSTTSCWARTQAAIAAFYRASRPCAATTRTPVQGGLRLHQYARKRPARRPAWANISFMVWATMSGLGVHDAERLLRSAGSGRGVHHRAGHLHSGGKAGRPH